MSDAKSTIAAIEIKWYGDNGPKNIWYINTAKRQAIISEVSIYIVEFLIGSPIKTVEYKLLKTRRDCPKWNGQWFQ